MDAIVNNRGWIFNAICIFFFAWQLQDFFIINSDVSWLIHASSLLLKGGSYTQNFLETNPPLILVLYSPIHYLIQYFHLPLIYALRLYVFLLASLSLLLCSYYLNDYFNKKADLIKTVCITNLGIIFLILPLADFGQREHLTFILIMPYLLSLATELFNRKTTPKWLTILVSSMAAIGFCLKPFNLGVLATIEAYYCYRKKSFLTVFRLENWVIILFICAYLSLIMIYHADYIDTIIPLITPFYYSLYTVKIYTLLWHPASVFIYFGCLLYFTRQATQSYLEDIVFIATLSFWMIFIFQRTNWYYHELPSLSFNFLLIGLLFSTLLSQRSISVSHYLLFIIMGFYFSMHESYIYTNIKFPFYLAGFFSLIAYIYWLILSKARNSVAAYCYTGIIILTTFFLYQYLAFTIWHNHAVILTSSMMLLLFAYCVPNQSITTLTKWLFLTCFGLLLFIYPFYRAAYVAASANYYNRLYQQLITRMQPYQFQSTYYFTNTSEIVFPLIHYSEQNYTSRFWSFVWLPILEHPSDFGTYSKFYQQRQSTFDLYIGSIVADFQQHAPEYVFVDDRINSKQFFYGATAPDFIRLFKENKQFAELWRSYQFVELINLPPLCRYQVYKHNGNLSISL